MLGVQQSINVTKGYRINMPNLQLVKPEQLTDNNMFYESVKEIVELGVIINKRAGDSFLGQYLESRKLKNAQKTYLLCSIRNTKAWEKRILSCF